MLGIGDGSEEYLALQTVDHVYLVDIDEAFVLVDSRSWTGLIVRLDQLDLLAEDSVMIVDQVDPVPVVLLLLGSREGTLSCQRQ